MTATAADPDLAEALRKLVPASARGQPFKLLDTLDCAILRSLVQRPLSTPALVEAVVARLCDGVAPRDSDGRPIPPDIREDRARVRAAGGGAEARARRLVAWGLLDVAGGNWTATESARFLADSFSDRELLDPQWCAHDALARAGIEVEAPPPPRPPTLAEHLDMLFGRRGTEEQKSYWRLHRAAILEQLGGTQR